MKPKLINYASSLSLSVLMGASLLHAENKQSKEPTQAKTEQQDTVLQTINHTIIHRMNHYSQKNHYFSRSEIAPQVTYLAQETSSDATTGDRTFTITKKQTGLKLVLSANQKSNQEENLQEQIVVATIRYEAQTKQLLALDTRSQQWLTIDQHPFLKLFPAVPKNK